MGQTINVLQHGNVDNSASVLNSHLYNFSLKFKKQKLKLWVFKKQCKENENTNYWLRKIFAKQHNLLKDFYIEFIKNFQNNKRHVQYNINGQRIWIDTSHQSCPTLCDPMDCSPPGSSVHGILQARILEWVVVPL